MVLEALRRWWDGQHPATTNRPVRRRIGLGQRINLIHGASPCGLDWADEKGQLEFDFGWK